MTTPSGPTTFHEAFSLRTLSPNEFETVHPPEQMGNAQKIAYGGYALGMAAKSAYRTVPAGYHLYSMTGQFLGPSQIDRPLCASVRTIRQTRTFATRLVEISQNQADGTKRACLIALTDFQIQEPGVLLTYSAPPKMTYTPVEKLPAPEEHVRGLVQQGKVHKKLAQAYMANFIPMQKFYDSRMCPEGIHAQNLVSIAKDVRTTQSHLPLTERRTAEWFRSRHQLDSEEDHVTSLAFNMDGAISFCPLSLDHKSFGDAGACSTLDFALRVFVNEVDLGEWCLKEIGTVVAAEGRTYSEARLWDAKGGLVASMTQQCIMRPPPAKGKL